MPDPYSGTKRSLVLGGHGFIGSHLIDALLSSGREVVSFDRPRISPAHSTSSMGKPVTYVDGDFTSTADILAAMDGCNECFHLISTTLPKTSNADPVYDAETNLLPTLRLLDLIVKDGAVKKLVFISSGGTVYGVPNEIPIHESHATNPVCAYGITKLAIEKYLELYRVLHGLQYSVLRLSNPFGERQRVESSQGAIAVFIGKLLQNEIVEIWGDGSVVRDYVHISDVVSAIKQAADLETKNRIFNIGSGQGRTLNEVLDVIESVAQTPLKRNYVGGRLFDVPANVLDIQRARHELGWAPKVSFRDGVREMYESVREQMEVRS